jgi:hypothetical protein
VPSQSKYMIVLHSDLLSRVVLVLDHPIFMFPLFSAKTLTRFIKGFGRH